MLTTTIKSIGTFALTATTSNSNTLSLTGIVLTVIPISTGIACGLSFGNKVINKMIMQKCNKYLKKQYQEDQETLKSFDKMYTKNLQDNIIAENEYKSPFYVTTKCLDEKNESFSQKYI